MENWGELDFWESAEKELIEKSKEEENRNKKREWGKLGGRPKKQIVKKVKINLRVTEKEKSILQAKADAWNISISEYVRRCSLNLPMPDAERNKLLVEYRTHFKRIANFFKSSVWNNEEKEDFKVLIKDTVKSIEKSIGV